MAGAGYKLFNTGDVLTAAQVNTYLQEQTVMVFASSTARTTALSGVLAEGMVSYLQDTNAVEVYNGSAWVGVSGAGDLTEIVAGTGITVTSGTGPIPTVALTTPVAATNGGTAQSTYTTGDLLYASGTNTLAKRAIGTTGQILTVSGGVPTWAAAAGGGGMTLLSTTTLSGASTTISSISQDYVTLIAHIENATNATADGLLNINPNSATQAHQISINGYNTTVSTSAQTGVEINTRKALAKGASEASLILRIDNYTLTTCPKPFHFYGHFITTDSERGTINAAGGCINSPYAAITSLVFSNAGGNFTGGTVRLYGVK